MEIDTIPLDKVKTPDTFANGLQRVNSKHSAQKRIAGPLRLPVRSIRITYLRN